MKLEVCTNDWFYNMGIVGFMKILENFDERYNIKGNCLEFDSKILEKFSDCYIDFLLEKYKPSYESNKNFVLSSLENLRREIDNQSYSKKIVEAISKFFKKAVEKAKKIGDDGLEKEITELISELKNLNKMNTKDAPDLIDNIKERAKRILGSKKLEKKFTADLVWNILHNVFFGQPSFLQLKFLNKPVVEWKKRIEEDYINPIFSNIIKLTDNSRKKCSLCGRYPAAKRNFEEMVFVPIALSTKNKNLFWNLAASQPLCDLCRLIMFCSPAGASYYRYKIKSPYKSQPNQIIERYVFVNLDVDLDTLYKINLNLEDKTETKAENPFTELILDYVGQTKTKSEWTIDGILFVEFNANFHPTKIEMEYFNVPRYMANFFVKQGDKTLKRIKNRDYKYLITNLILNNRNTNNVIYHHINLAIKNEFDPYDVFYSIMVGALIEVYKKNVFNRREEIAMKPENMTKKLWHSFKSGQEIRRYLEKSDSENKINGIAYRLMNSIKAGNKGTFMDTILRIYISADKPVPGIFIEAFSDEKIDFEKVAQAFITGLITPVQANNTEGGEING